MRNFDYVGTTGGLVERLLDHIREMHKPLGKQAVQRALDETQVSMSLLFESTDIKGLWGELMGTELGDVLTPLEEMKPMDLKEKFKIECLCYAFESPFLYRVV